MTQKAPGKFFRKGMSLKELFEQFPNNEEAKKWFTKTRWNDSPYCPHCGSVNVQSGTKHKTMPYRCRERECRKRFSIRTATVMEGSNIDFQTWLIAIYLHTTNLKGVSSMKLHRDLNITQKSTWHLSMRIRKAFEDNRGLFSGTVEVDEVYIGGLEKNKHENKKLKQGRGATGKTAVLGIKDRESNEVKAKVIDNTKRKTLHGFINESVEPGSTVHTDDFPSYEKLEGYNHGTVKHSVGEYVNEQIHINGMESFWAVLKRAHKGVYHQMNKKHLNRYVKEFEGRHNVRNQDTIDQMQSVAIGMVGKRLKYKELTEN